MKYTLVNPRQPKPKWPAVVASYLAGKSVDEILQACGGYLNKDQIARSLRNAGVVLPRKTKPEAGRKGATNRRSRPEPAPNTPPALCPCGCGKIAKLAPRSDRGKGWIKGQPLRCRRGSPTKNGQPF